MFMCNSNSNINICMHIMHFDIAYNPMSNYHLGCCKFFMKHIKI